jgi:hypothetical protein
LNSLAAFGEDFLKKIIFEKDVALHPSFARSRYLEDDLKNSGPVSQQVCNVKEPSLLKVVSANRGSKFAALLLAMVTSGYE